MAEGLGRERWSHTSALMALIANANRDPKKSRPFKPSDFDPYAKDARNARKRRRQATPADLTILKQSLKRTLMGSKGSTS